MVVLTCRLTGTQLTALDPSSTVQLHGPLEAQVLAELAKYYSTDTSRMAEAIQHWNYDVLTANYFLLCERRRKGHR